MVTPGRWVCLGAPCRWDQRWLLRAGRNSLLLRMRIWTHFGCMLGGSFAGHLWRLDAPAAAAAQRHTPEPRLQARLCEHGCEHGCWSSARWRPRAAPPHELHIRPALSATCPLARRTVRRVAGAGGGGLAVRMNLEGVGLTKLGFEPATSAQRFRGEPKPPTSHGGPRPPSARPR